MKKKLIAVFTVVFTFLCFTVSVQANTMTNFSGSGVFTTYQEDGILMANNLGNGFWDAYLVGDAVHLDDGMVTVSMVDNSLFDLGYVMFDYNNAPVDFTFSNGSTWTLPGSGWSNPQTVDFTSLAFASNLLWFTIDGNLDWCTQIAEINMTPSVSVPEPATILLFGMGIAGLAVSRLRRR